MGGIVVFIKGIKPLHKLDERVLSLVRSSRLISHFRGCCRPPLHPSLVLCFLTNHTLPIIHRSQRFEFDDFLLLFTMIENLGPLLLFFPFNILTPFCDHS